jgi:SAM-dependent methyltransferase
MYKINNRKKNTAFNKVSSLLGSRYDSICSERSAIESEKKKESRRQIFELLRTSKTIANPCLCSKKCSTHFEILSLVDRNSLPVRNVICKACGTIRINPLPSNDFYRTVYSKFYWPLMHGNSTLTRGRFGLSVRRAVPYWNYLKRKVSLREKKVLELGASYGAGLFLLKDQKCKCLVGYDYDGDFVKKGIEYSDIDLRIGGIDEAINDGSKYDFLILRHVLEHFIDPVSSLRKIKQLLTRSGLIFVEVPGVFNPKLWGYDPMMYFDLFHPFSYSLNTLKMLMHNSGYCLVDGNHHVYSLWEIDEVSSVDRVDLKEEYCNIRNFLIRIENKRMKRRKFFNSFLGKITSYIFNNVKYSINRYCKKK